MLNSPGKAAVLNPNAAVFVPFSLRPSSGATIPAETTVNSSSSGNIGNTGLERSLSSVSINSDEETRQFWSSQLPDDITPDFNVMGDESSGLVSLSLGGLSLHDGTESSRYSGAGSGYLVNQQQELLPHRINGNNFNEKPSSGSLLNSQAKPWDGHMLNTDPLAGITREEIPYNGNSKHGYRNNMLTERTVEESGIAPLDFLAAQFPGFVAENLAEVYLTNRCDLNQTIEMLSQLELQVDGGGMYPNLSMKTLSDPNLSTMDFPPLSMQDGQQHGRHRYAGDDLQGTANPYQPLNDNMLMFRSNSSMSSRSTIDHASPAKNLAPQDSSIWNFDRNGSVDAGIGSSRSSHVLASSYNGGHGRPVFGEKLQNRGSTWAAPWLETGEAGMYADLREESHDHPRMRNAYFEQAHQAYLIGNRAITKQLSVKGQLYDMHMKAAHEQAQEAIFRQRNPITPGMQSNGRGREREKERVIDLHGLHLNEAILWLKNELPILRTVARATEQRIQVYICVGTGHHHTRGTRAPARLPIGVQQYLLEEGLDFTEAQPGILRVVIY